MPAVAEHRWVHNSYCWNSLQLKCCYASKGAHPVRSCTYDMNLNCVLLTASAPRLGSVLTSAFRLANLLPLKHLSVQAALC